MNTKLLCAVLLAVSIGRAEANENQIAGKADDVVVNSSV